MLSEGIEAPAEIAVNCRKRFMNDQGQKRKTILDGEVNDIFGNLSILW